MPLSVESRRLGDVVILKCNGRIVAGTDCATLDGHITKLLPHDRHIVLHLGDVHFIDSSGLGLLVRALTRTQAAHGDLKLCSVPPVVAQTLKLTHIDSLLDSHESEAEAVDAFYRRNRTAVVGSHAGPTVLCVDPSSDVLAYVRELLRHAGYSAVTASNFPDALILLTATRPALIVLGAAVRALPNTSSAEAFRRAAESMPVVEMSSDFSTADAGQAGQQLLEQVRSHIAANRIAKTGS